jgi:hypothetical protein
LLLCLYLQLQAHTRKGSSLLRRTHQRLSASLKTSDAPHSDNHSKLSSSKPGSDNRMVNEGVRSSEHIIIDSSQPAVTEKPRAIVRRLSSAEREGQHPSKALVDRSQSTPSLWKQTQDRSFSTIKLRSSSPLAEGILVEQADACIAGHSSSPQPANLVKTNAGRRIFIRSGPPLLSPDHINPTGRAK